jgi:hypothetical protein
MCEIASLALAELPSSENQVTMQRILVQDFDVSIECRTRFPFRRVATRLRTGKLG